MKYLYLIISIYLIVAIITIWSTQKYQYELFDSHHLYICVGDSILNNANYVDSDSTVISHLSKKINIESVAQDHARINDAFDQLVKVHTETNNVSIILSIGGNNLLNMENIHIVYDTYVELVQHIDKHYRKGDGAIYLLNLYYPIDESMKHHYPTIKHWNILLKQLDKYPQIRIVDISSIMNTTNDFTNIIEPSNQGGIKIATAITSST